MSDATPKGGIVEVESPASINSLNDTTQGLSDARWCISARAVSWWEVHDFIAPVLDRVGSWPMVGSVAWQQLPDDDPRKIAAIFDAARHWALRVEMTQEARCEASQAISVAAGFDDDGDPITWPQVARHARDQEDFYAQHPWAKRRPA